MHAHPGTPSAPGHGTVEDPVLVRREGRAGHIVLNRPRALNSLTLDMVRRIDAALTAWEHDERVTTVVVSGAGERGLCAGGDIRGIHDDAKYGDGSASRTFWREEYHLNARIARYPKPYVALMDGVVMGGGVGVSAHGSVRVVTERSKVAMPETGIGFVPDVGGTYLLSLAPGALGTYLALTAAPVGADDALLCGLADHRMDSSRLDAFVLSLAEMDAADAVRLHVTGTDSASADTEDQGLAAHREWIDSCFSADSVEEIVERLRAHGSPAAKEAAETVCAKSPTALKVTLAALRRARELGPLERVLDQEYRVSCAALSSHDLVEGVRAQIVDKDRKPQWSPARLEDVQQADVERHFAPLGAAELGLGAGLDGTESPW